MDRTPMDLVLKPRLDRNQARTLTDLALKQLLVRKPVRLTMDQTPMDLALKPHLGLNQAQTHTDLVPK